MPTINQLVHGEGRQPKSRRDERSFLNFRSGGKGKAPQKRGVCLQVKTMTPKKPNSALRKVTRVRLSNGFIILCYIPGEGHNLQEHSVVLVQGRGPADLPGCRARVIRGALGTDGVKNRKRNRSRYGAKKPKL